MKIVRIYLSTPERNFNVMKRTYPMIKVRSKYEIMYIWTESKMVQQTGKSFQRMSLLYTKKIIYGAVLDWTLDTTIAKVDGSMRPF